MKNETLRIRAMRQYVLEALGEAERTMSDTHTKDVLTQSASARGYLEGAMKVIVKDCDYWLREIADERTAAEAAAANG